MVKSQARLGMFQQILAVDVW